MSLLGTLHEPGLLRLSPLWLSRPMLFLSALRDTWERRPQAYLGDHTLLTRTIFGHAMYLDTRDLSLTPHLVLQGYWEPDVTRFFLRLVKPGMHVADVGANVGYYTLLACSLVGGKGRVTAFEANPALALLARRSISVNGFRARARVMDVAVTDAPGRVTLYSLEHRQGDSSISAFSAGELAFPGDRVTEINASATSLDVFLEDDSVDLVRMDVEGAEPLVFDGMQRIIARNPALRIVMEWFPERIRCVGRDPVAFLRSIAAAGFRFQRVSAGGRLERLSETALLECPFAEIYLSR